jgi:hypothetical protein
MLDAELRAQLEGHWEPATTRTSPMRPTPRTPSWSSLKVEGVLKGVENFREWRRRYPARLAFKIRRMDRSGDLVIAEDLISYDGAEPMYTVHLIELNADDKIVPERVYITEGWEAPEWRSPWRSATPADSSHGGSRPLDR